MKSILRASVLWALTTCAKVRLWRLKKNGAMVVGVTGSMGKTTCKEAVAHVLRGQFRVLCSAKSYNTEFGLPLTILGLKSEFSSITGWTGNLARAMWKCVMDREIFDVIVLEMGVDKKGDMDTLLDVIIPDVTIFTGVHPVHMAAGQFADLDAIFEEKSKLVKAVKSGGAVYMDYGDERCRKLGGQMAKIEGGAKVVMYGMDDSAKLKASEIKSGKKGIEFMATYGEVTALVEVPILGKQHVGSILPAIGGGLLLGMYMKDIVARLEKFKMPPGRLSLIDGINKSLIVDSSYNASPDAVRAAVNTIQELGAVRRIFVFGNMNELGVISEKEHREIAPFLQGKIDILVTVGDMAKLCGEEFVKKGSTENNVIWKPFSDAIAAAEFMKNEVKEGDVVLVKGSQNKVRLEKLVKQIMLEPQRAGELLARQDWADA